MADIKVQSGDTVIERYGAAGTMERLMVVQAVTPSGQIVLGDKKTRRRYRPDGSATLKDGWSIRVATAEDEARIKRNLLIKKFQSTNWSDYSQERRTIAERLFNGRTERSDEALDKIEEFLNTGQKHHE